MAYSQVAVRKRNIGSEEEFTGRKAEIIPLRSTYDYTLLFLVIFLFSLGLLFIYSGSQYSAAMELGDGGYFFKRQLIIGGAGLAGALVISKMPYRILKKGSIPWLIWAGAAALLVLTLLMGNSTNGKTRWLSIAGVSFQPAELAKIGIIVYEAALCDAMKKEIRNPKAFWFAAAMGAVPTLLILMQNISSAFIVMVIVMVMLFVAAGKSGLFSTVGALMVGGVLASKPLIRKYLLANEITKRPSQYWMRRVYGWALPEVFADDAYQTQQGLYAIGSGGITGRGLGESIQKFGKIPEVQNDMIFSVVCEEFGFIGAAALVILYLFLLYRIMLIAKNAKDRFGAMICVGVMAHMATQVILNISVVTGVIPNTGVTLPFISYGGTAVLFTMLEMGLVLSVSNGASERR